MKIERILDSESSYSAMWTHSKSLMKVKALCIQEILLSSCYHFYNIVRLIPKAFEDEFTDFICVHTDRIMSQEIRSNLEVNAVGWHSFFI